MKTTTLLVSIAALIFGCAVSEIAPMDGGTYFVHKRSAQVGFGPANGAKADIYAAASRFCSRQGKSVETVKLDMVDSGLARPASASLQFRCVDSRQ